MREDEAVRFFDDFVDASSTFSGAKVGERYQSPFLAVGASGAATVFTTAEEIASYFQAALDDYRSRGCRSCRYSNLEIVPLGLASTLLTVTWELLRGDGGRAMSWRESYVVVRRDEGLVVCASVDHAA